MRVPDSLAAWPPSRSAGQAQPASAQANDAFWQDLFKAATAIENGAQTDPGVARNASQGNERSGASSDLATQDAASVSASLEPDQNAAAGSSQRTGWTPLVDAAVSDVPPVPGRPVVPSDRSMSAAAGTRADASGAAASNDLGKTDGNAQSSRPHGVPGTRDLPWQATFVVDAHGQRRLFLRAAQLSEAQALDLAAALAQQGDTQDAALESIHLNGQAIYRQPGSDASGTLLIC